MSNQVSSTDFFSRVVPIPADPILRIFQAYKDDKDANKINLSVGVYRDNDEKPYLFQVVRQALADVTSDPDMDMEYLPVDGHAGFRTVAQELIFGNDLSTADKEKIVTVQTISGTGALRVGFEFLKIASDKPVLISKPAWPLHYRIMERTGFKWEDYPYITADCSGLDFEGMYKTIDAAESGTIVLLHVCAHNPTGVDPSREQWEELAKLIKKKELLPFMDCAYQGFASGDLDRDAAPVRIFLREGISMLVAQSFSKNFGLYGERVGALHVVCESKGTTERVSSQLKALINPMYSFPPSLGPKIVHTILTNPGYTQLWLQELKTVSDRILNVRQLLYNELVELKVKGNWGHILSQIGMFSYTGLTAAQCEVLVEKHHVYIPPSGRMSMTGVNTHNVKYLANAIKQVVEEC